jgi:hypothetical protein
MNAPNRSMRPSLGYPVLKLTGRKSRGFTLGISLALLLAACGDDSEPTGWEDGPPTGTYIDEPIVLQGSALISPIDIEEGTFVFDLSHVELVVTDSLSEISVRYLAPTCFDEDAYVRDFGGSGWRQFSRGHAPDAHCVGLPTRFSHLFSYQELEPGALIGEGGRMEIRGDFSEPTVQVLRIHPDYDVTSLPRRTTHLTYASGSIIVIQSTPDADSVFGFDPQHGLLNGFALPGPYWPAQALTWDGSSYWVAFACCVADDPTSWAFRLTPSGEVMCDFPLGVYVSGGMASDGNRLWFVGQRRQEQFLYTCDIGQSCAQGVAEIISQTSMPGPRVSAIAWDGSGLLVAGDRLYRLTVAGAQTGSYPLPVSDIQDVAWDGKRVCLLNLGLKDFGGSEKVLSRFWLR